MGKWINDTGKLLKDFVSSVIGIDLSELPKNISKEFSKAVDNIKEMFAGIVEIGNDLDMRGNIRTGSILLENMTIAGAD